MFLSVFGSGFLQASGKIAERNGVLARAQSRRSLRAYDPLWVQFVGMYALEQRIERKIERPLVKNVGGAVLEFAVCAPLWFLEIRVLPPDGLRGAFKIARDGLHLTALRILHGTTRGFSELQAVTSDVLQNCAGRRLTLVRILRSHDRRSSELRAATSDGLQNCAR